MRHIFRLTLSLGAAAVAGVLCASGPTLAREDKPETAREEKAEAKPTEKPDAKRDDKAKRAEKPTAKERADRDSAYLRKIGQLLRARAPGTTNLGEGTATVRFRLGASGAADRISVVSATTPGHGELARSIVSGLRAPPPPGGSYQGVQSFRFH